MKQQTAVVLGATGLIGSHVVRLLLQDESFATVRVLVRKSYPHQHPKLEVQQVYFPDRTDFKNKLGRGDVIFSCIGTTNSKVKGDKEAYRRIDYDIPIDAAAFAVDAGFTRYLLVSSVGANAAATNFYVRLKGEVEEALSKISIPGIHIFQPSILYGERDEFRLGELIGKGLMKALSFILVGSISKYKGINASDVAKAMVAASKKQDEGIKRYQYKEMMVD